MPIDLTPDEQLEIIENIKARGIDEEENGLYSDYIAQAKNYINAKFQGEEKEDKKVEAKFENVEVLDSLKGMSPGEIRNYILDSDIVKPETAADFEKKFNESKIVPYKIKVDVKGDKTDTSFEKKLDRYELGPVVKQRDRDGRVVNKPLYFKFYEDGTYETVDAFTFNREKMFNVLPKKYREKITSTVYREGLSPENKGRMDNYLNHFFEKNK